MKITRVEVMTVAPQVQRYTWSHDIPEQFMTNTIVRIHTDAEVEGIGGVSNYTSYDFDRYTCETLRHLIPVLVGQDPLMREQLFGRLWPRVFPYSPQALAAVDIALWDLQGKVAGLPVYQMLGGTQDRILSYASTPLFEDIPTYLKFVDEMIEQGFRAIKFHCWCLPEKDRALARAVRQAWRKRHRRDAPGPIKNNTRRPPSSERPKIDATLSKIAAFAPFFARRGAPHETIGTSRAFASLLASKPEQQARARARAPPPVSRALANSHFYLGSKWQHPVIGPVQ